MSKKANEIIEFVQLNNGIPLRTLYSSLKTEGIFLFDWHIKQYLSALQEAQKIEIKEDRVYVKGGVSSEN